MANPLTVTVTLTHEQADALISAAGAAVMQLEQFGGLAEVAALNLRQAMNAIATARYGDEVSDFFVTRRTDGRHES